jgi:outer membrane protein assembly factor BamD
MSARYHYYFVKFLGVGFLLTGLIGCSWLPEQIDETKGWSASQLYSKAKEALDEGSYQTAIDYFEKLQARYPFGRYAQQAQLELIYAHYKNNEPDLAIATADRFIKTNPRNPFVDYAYYMKGIINFSRQNTVLDRLAPNDRAQTDTAATRQSYNDFAELVTKFPNSKYAEDARQRMLFLHNKLAAYEINVADYYMRREAYVAATNRATNVLENYAQTPSVPDALVILTEAYAKLGLTDLARDSLEVLKLNYPDSSEIPKLTALLNGEKAKSSFSLFGFQF